MLPKLYTFYLHFPKTCSTIKIIITAKKAGKIIMLEVYLSYRGVVKVGNSKLPLLINEPFTIKLYFIPIIDTLFTKCAYFFCKIKKTE